MTPKRWIIEIKTQQKHPADKPQMFKIRHRKEEVMKKTIAIASLVAAVALFLSGCASVSKDWNRATTQDNATAYDAFLQKHRDSQYASEAKVKIQELDWKQAQASSTMASFREFLQKHPDSQYASEAKVRVSSYTKGAWEKAQKQDKIYGYESFMRDYPDSEYFKEAKERAVWQKANPAVVKIDYPMEIRVGTTSSRSYNGPIYKWDTVFKETGGKTGFKLKATDFYIRDPSGGRWSNSWSKDVEVRPNGKATVDYWCDTDAKWAGGYYHTIWIGEDDWGNKIKIVQEVHLVK
jgi:hypothetical protein